MSERADLTTVVMVTTGGISGSHCGETDTVLVLTVHALRLCSNHWDFLQK